jgi:hypothetical protein
MIMVLEEEPSEHFKEVAISRDTQCFLTEKGFSPPQAARFEPKRLGVMV